MKSPFPLILLLSFLVSCTSPEEQALEATLTFVGTSGMYFSHHQQWQFLADGSGCGHFLRMHEGGIRQVSRSAGTDDGFESDIRSGGKRTFHKSGDCVFECKNFPVRLRIKGDVK